MHPSPDHYVPRCTMAFDLRKRVRLGPKEIVNRLDATKMIRNLENGYR